MSNHVLVIDTHKRPLTPCKPSTARRLLNAGKAAVFRRYPFTIILKKEVNASPDPCQLKLDPGSKTTGIALVKNGVVMWAAELTHRGQQIKNALESRRSLRRGRRGRKTRYRKPRFLNRARPNGWLAPSLMHRVLTIDTWVSRIIRFCAVGSIAQELVKFDPQLMQNPEVSGVEYQQGTLAGYTVREYLLEKWDRTCAYCGAQNVPLQIEHIHPRSRGGSNRVSNLALACEPCNTRKGTEDVKAFLSGQLQQLEKILKQAKAPLKDAAAVNATRWTLLSILKSKGVPVTTGSGAQTKYNRVRFELPKTHWLDAACVGELDSIEVVTQQPLLIKSSGHGCRQVIHVDKFGFPRRNKKGDLVRKSAKAKTVKGFQTGDIVRATVTKTTKTKTAGTHVGRIAVRSTGSFNISTVNGVQQGISWKDCTLVHQGDGYGYAF